MTHHALKKGLDLPIEGAPAPAIEAAASPVSVALLGGDYVGLKPRMFVQEGDTVRRGTALFCHKDSPEVVFTAPATGRIRAINRGARRVLQSVVIDIDDADDTGMDFHAADPATQSAEQIAAKLLDSGLWTAFRTRPYSKVPAGTDRPAAIYVTAMESDPLAPDAKLVLDGAAEAFDKGLMAVSKLSAGKTYLCQRQGETLSGGTVPGVEIHTFEGPHPAGLPGTHMHFIEPPHSGKTVWHIGYQDVLAIGRLFETGFVDPVRVITVAGPRAAHPRHVRTMMGADMATLTARQISGDAPVRVISGSVLSGFAADGPFGFLGRYHRQVTLITEDAAQEVLGWISPQPGKFSVQPVLASSFLGSKLYALTSNLNGGRRAMVPTGVFETLMPQDYLPTQLLRALLVGDTDTAQALGALELDEEDLALCTFACPAKYEYGMALRTSLARIEKEG
ncbi:Na(+)-translocating NADH-quinone reductase subunit A [Mangrovicoccus algicola]|uniref:Na(+)-translocating NADH-quinone reductase subunit A n=1 Tax=Mangrovicoccus algicola TaxID=2771008 RepID=A0A8J6YUB7_9RHOB|nr:Na(+)-translocating NADH-quinone reductase subunit A [Mangrovicoccus algicola]MBE3637870.1 Na(+)-translocating NADH-quinone reductase subunit A [Mangrovicoccus algicola]